MLIGKIIFNSLLVEWVRRGMGGGMVKRCSGCFFAYPLFFT